MHGHANHQLFGKYCSSCACFLVTNYVSLPCPISCVEFNGLNVPVLLQYVIRYESVHQASHPCNFGGGTLAEHSR